MSTATSQLATAAVRIPVRPGMVLHADVTVPPEPTGLVLFADGTGAARHNPRNRAVAADLNVAGMATVVADLLTEEEEEVDEHSGTLRYDIALLTRRMVTVIEWAADAEPLRGLPVGLLGGKTGAAAVLDAAALRPEIVRAVVSRCGRPDLATRLNEVAAPTLLIVAGRDKAALGLNANAGMLLRCPKKLEVVPCASRIEEQGTVGRAGELAATWFEQHLGPRTAL